MATEDTPMHDADSFQSNSRMISNGSNQEIRLAIARLADSNKISSGQKDGLMEMVGNQDSAILAVIERNLSPDAIESALLDLLQNHSQSSSSSKSSANGGVAPMEDDDPSSSSGDAANQPLQEAVQKLCAEANTNSKIRIVKQGITHMKKIVQALIQHPEKSKNRSLKKKNFSFKKFILDVPGALEILRALGFVETNERNAEVVAIDEATCAAQKDTLFPEALVLLDEATERLVPITNPTSGPRELCTAGCGFFGDATLDGLCSKCHREKVRTGQVKPKKVEEKKSQAPSKPRQYCTNKCGFWGSEEFAGLCSKCHRQKFGDPKNPPRKVRTAPELWKAARFKLHLVHRWRRIADIDQKDKSRCWVCNKKMGILGIQCRCRYYFCAKHRTSRDHDCPFDYKALQEKKLRKENPLVEASKLDKM